MLLDETVIEEKRKTEEKPVFYATGGGIAILSFDRGSIILCHSVKYSPHLFPAKDEPRYSLYGIDKVGFFGEHLNLLSWYASLEDVQKEMKAITDAISEGRPSYELRYNADVELKGFFGQPHIKQK